MYQILMVFTSFERAFQELQNGIKITLGGALVEGARTKSAKNHPVLGLPEQLGAQRPPLRRFWASFRNGADAKGVQKLTLYPTNNKKCQKN